MSEKDIGTLTLGCGLAQLAALKPHWGFIHYRERFEPPPITNKKATHLGGFFIGGDVGTLTLGCVLAQLAALKPHRGFIHYRERFESPPITNKEATRLGGFFIGGDVGTRTLDLCDVNTAL